MISSIDRMRQRHGEEIQELQDSCAHKSHSRMPYMWAPGHFGNDVEVCDDCGKILKNYEDASPLDTGDIVFSQSSPSAISTDWIVS